MAKATYPVTELFHSIQGEGLNVGRSAWFVRLAGCNYSCPGCDEPLHDQPKKSKKMTAEEIAQALTTPADLVVITGGEPAMYDLTPMIQAIREMAHAWPVMKIHPASGQVGVGPLICIETNGSLSISEDIDFICVSPKPVVYAKDKKNGDYNLDTLERADEIKMVVGWTEGTKEAVEERLDYFCSINPMAQLFLSPLTQFPGNTLIPEWTEKTVELVKAFPGVRLSLQTHKWLNIR